MWLCMRKVRNFVSWLHHEPKESVCFKIPNVLSQVLNAILTTSGKSYQSRQTRHFQKNMSPVNQGMGGGGGGGTLKGALSGDGCAAQTLPFKIFKSVLFAALFRDLRLWEHLLCFFMIFGFNEVFFAVYGSHHPSGPRATKQWQHIPVLLVLKCTSRSVYPLKGDNRCKTL